MAERKQLTRRTLTHVSANQISTDNNSSSPDKHSTGIVSSKRSVPSGTADSSHSGKSTADQGKQHNPDKQRRVLTNPLSDLKNDLEPVYGTDTPDKHAGGRPTKYTPDMCDKVIEFGKKGYTKEHMALELDVYTTTLDDWCKAHDEFYCALKEAVFFAQGFMEKMALDALSSEKDFKTTLWSKIVSCRFPATYREVTHNKHSGLEGGLPIPVAVANVQMTGEGLKDYYKQFMDRATRPKNAAPV